MKIFARDRLSRLQACTDAAIWLSHNATQGLPARRHLARSAPEEDYVASFILLGMRLLYRAWRPLFRQWRIGLSLTGVFCHQTPKARFIRRGRSESPELADLLLVRRHRYLHGGVRRAAVLVQTKMSDTGEVVLPKNDPQLYLMTVWPTFKVLGSMAPKTDFCIGRDERQALYAGIRTRSTCPGDNDAWAGFCPWAMLQPQLRGWVQEPLSWFLVKLLNFEAGRDFHDPVTTGCHWSELVHYLLKVTFSLPLRTRDMRLDDPRGISIGSNRMGFVSADPGITPAYIPRERWQELRDGGEGQPPDEVEAEFAEGGEGRIIIIETSEMEA